RSSGPTSRSAICAVSERGCVMRASDADPSLRSDTSLSETIESSIASRTRCRSSAFETHGALYSKSSRSASPLVSIGSRSLSAVELLLLREQLPEFRRVEERLVDADLPARDL